MTAPLTPTDCDLRDFSRMMIDISRLRQSDFDATPDDSAWRAGLNLWFSAWHSVPAGSLADDDAALAKAAGLGRDLRTWRKVKAGALHGFERCEDGRLYHATVSEMALEAWIEKLVQRLSSGAGNAKRWGAAFDPAEIEAAIDRSVALLAALAPNSKSIPKARRRHSRPEEGGTPTGTEKRSHRDAKSIPPGSLEKGTGKGTGILDSDPDGSGGEPPHVERDDLAELRALEPKTGAWRLAVKVLTSRGGFPEARARTLVGKWAKETPPAELWKACEAAWRSRTLDPVSYITAALERIAEEERDPLKNPTETRQRLWMTDFTARPRDWRDHERGPKPGQPGCRVSPEIQREFGVEPAGPQVVKGAA